MSNEIMKPETTAVVVGAQAENVGGALAALGLGMGDISIPKILLMQSTSKLVGDEKAIAGDLVNSLTEEKLGNSKSTLEILPLDVYRTWVTYDMTSGQLEYLRTEPMTAANDMLPWEDKEGSMIIRRDACLNFMVLLVRDVPTGEAFPYVISYRRTGYKAGKNLATHLLKQFMFKQPNFGKVWGITLNKEKEGTNTYFIFSGMAGRTATPDERNVCSMWAQLLSTKKYTVDESDVKPEQKQSAPEPTIVGENTQAEELY